MSNLILGIETSCDETAAAIIRVQRNQMEVLSNVVSSQVKLHSAWGGVVPNLAAREHLKNIIPVVEASFREAHIRPKDLTLICVTAGPGLIPALLIGVNAAKTLSYAWKKSLLGIHHIEGHIYANFIHNPASLLPLPRGGNKGGVFPILCLVVSGGHTQLILMKKHLDYEIVGETLDDAAGEAFDKVARILGLGYPGGPAIAQSAMEILNSKSQIPNLAYQLASLPASPSLGGRSGRASKLNIKFPRPMINSSNLNFSFSGLKTAVLYETKKHPNWLKNKQYIKEVCYEFQQAVVEVLVHKTIKAAEKYSPQTIMLAGGVSANQELRKQLKEAIKLNLPATSYQLLAANYSLDNAAMIAAAGFYRWKLLSGENKKTALDNWKKLQADANLKLTR